VRRRDKEVIEIGECASLAFVIDRLQALSRSLPPDSQPEVIVGGNDYFGWRLTVSFSRELTPEEMALEAKYSLRQSDGQLSSRSLSRSDWATMPTPGRPAGRPHSELRS
jgi:hypothetical protein